MLSTVLGSQLRRAWPLAVGVGGGLLLLESSQGALS